MSNGKNTRTKRKYWVFTLNKPTIAEEILCKRLDYFKAAYIIFGRERGESGTFHFQGYIEFVNRRRLSELRKLLPRAHWEVRKGTGREASEYCKKDGDFVEKGTLATNERGRRTDLECIRAELDSGRSMSDIAESHFSQWVVYRRSFEAYIDLKSPPKFRRELRVVLLHGCSGVGKSSYVYSRHPECWISTNPVLRWFDGYSGQDVVLLDDFNGECPFRFLLRLLDVYPLRVEVKGGHVAWNPTLIYITSNNDPEEWYHGEKDMSPVIRRITHSIRVSDDLGDSVNARHEAIDKILNE